MPRPPTLRRSVRAAGWSAVALGLSTAALLSADLRAQQNFGADALKAAFVARFPEFIEWPPDHWEGRDELEICVASSRPVDLLIGETTEGTTMTGRQVVVRDIDLDDDIATCHVLFVSSPDADVEAALLDRADSLPILTVGDAPGFLNRGGVINLMVVGSRVRFTVNLAAAERARLRVSSRLLRLASGVQGDQP